MRQPRAIALLSTIALAAAGVAAAPAPTRAASFGSPIVLDSSVEMHGYDAVTDSAGTAYVGWISDSTSPGSPRQVHLCVLPKGATACSGGVQTDDALGASSATDLHMVLGAGDHPLLYWQYQTPSSINGPFGDGIAQAVVASQVLGAASAVTDAPSFGDLGDVAIAPSGAPALVLLASPPVSGARAMYFDYLTLSHPSIPSPYFVGSAHLAFAGTTPVLTIDKYGAISSPVRSSAYVNGSWTPWANVPGTWSLGGAYDTASTLGGVRLVASQASASYHPAQHHWTGSAFSAGTPTGDNASCSPNTEDLTYDASGRTASVASSCAGNAVTNLPTTNLAGGVVHTAIGGTPTNAPEGGGPQITTSPRGRGWVAWTYQASGGGEVLAVRSMILPPAYAHMHNSTSFGTATLTAPMTCLPPTSATMRITAAGKNGWTPIGHTLRFDGSVSNGSIAGASLVPGSDHTLKATARFRSRAGTVKTMSFGRPLRSCPNP